jgi:signal transduction histidine kinase
MAARLHSLNSLLLNAKAQWEKAFDAAAEVFVLHGPDGRILRANTALSALTGLPIRQCIGRTCMEILPGLCAGHDSAGTDWRHPGSGADFLVMTQTVNLGGEAATLHVLRNVTEERRLSAIEEDRRRSAFVRDILQGIAHEIRNPIFGIQTLLQALDIRHSHDDQERAFTEKALREIHRLDGIVRRFLQLAFLEDASPLETAPVEDLVSQAATLVESRSPTAKTDRIRLSPSLRGRTAQVHRQSFVEALAEILDNACLYSPPDASVEVSGRWDGDGWEMRIRDEGPGVPYGFEERIFEPFFTTAPSRSGLGLALARAGLARDGGRTGLLREEGSRGAIILIRFSK